MKPVWPQRCRVSGREEICIATIPQHSLGRELFHQGVQMPPHWIKVMCLSFYFLVSFLFFLSSPFLEYVFALLKHELSLLLYLNYFYKRNFCDAETVSPDNEIQWNKEVEDAIDDEQAGVTRKDIEVHNF